MSARKPAPTVRLRRLTAELRRHRQAAGLTREDVVERTGINAATLYRIESARVRPQPRTLAALLEAYAVDEPVRAELTTLLKAAGQRSWLHTLASELPERYASYIEFESEAQELLTYQSLHIPGLLQTADYARAVTRGSLPDAGAEDVERRVEARLKRQAALTGAKPLRLWAIVDEAALRRSVGGSTVMAAQLAHLRETAESPSVTLQVIPFDAGAHPGLVGSFTLMRFPEAVGPEVVYIESQAGDLFLEEPEDVDRYRVSFEHLRAVALSPTASAAATYRN
ncbi:helix-turn-helix domain-containing protein [Actinomadura rayongensis]|uniref:Helix-turn-helix domain-containing protein n=1 Tax=Actinomadura rayongensis TaxID=1429076 RepID=A0A6I4WE44_9ACTN|nr:helix-turn-helix transcriptional regulator [Actinomadura rayongensis]MXQ66535.1 helix-turn-helix domain-containing protein [Actinomadura rayongensis]